MQPWFQRALDFIRRRRNAYRRVFSSDGSKIVLEDLARFCRANQSCFHPDHAVHQALEGRREVWLRIQQHLNLSSEQLYQIYNPAKLGQSQTTNGEDNDD